MNITEKYCLKWNEFSLYICDSFKELRDDTDFCDVTLACDDGEQVQANKIVLSSCSPVLKHLLKSNPHPHPVVILRGYTSQYLKQLIDFMYFGEVDVAQTDFDEFLKGAKDLQVKGLSEDESYHSKSKPPRPVKTGKTKDVSNKPPQPPPPVKQEEPRPKSPKILEVVKTKVSINPMMIDDSPVKQLIAPPQFDNVTISHVKNDVEQENKPVTVKKQELDDDTEDIPECYDVSDSEDTFMASENSEESFQETHDNKLLVDTRAIVETVEASVKKVVVATKHETAVTNPTVTRAGVQPVTVTFAPVQTYSEVPQSEIYHQATSSKTISQTLTPIQTDPLKIKARKPVVVENMPKNREREEDPILKMFSMRSAGGWSCTTCGQFSNHKNAMKIHIQSNHMSEFGHACDECGKSFRTRGRLLSHIDQAHTAS